MNEKHNLIIYIKTNDWKKVETLLEKYPKLLNTELNDSNHLWYHNMANKTIDTENTENIILKLCTKYKEFVDLERKNSAGATPLLLAVLNGKFYQTRAFLKLGSDISTRDDRGKSLWKKCCNSNVANMKNKKKILDLLDNPPPKYSPHTDIHHHFNKIELCEYEPDEPVADD